MSWPEPVPEESLSCLNTWPEGTVGYKNDEQLLIVLNNLCKEHGYGFVPQLCEQLKELWYHSEQVEHFEKIRVKRLERLKSYL